MTKLFLLLAIAASSSVAHANPEVGVSVTVNQPGLYGRIDIGNAPVPPAVVYRQPVIIAPAPVVVQPPAPVYLHVPPGHRRNWRKHCHRYNACGQPVYFVREDWYQKHYPPHRDGRHDDRRDDRDRHGR